MRPGPVDRVVSKARDDVPVAMIDRLAGGLAIVDDHVEPVGPRGRADGSAQPGQKRADRGGHGLRELAQMSVMSLGHEQRVAAIDRIDVEEGHGFGRLEYFGRGDRAVGDLAEYAVRIVRSMAQRSHRLAVVSCEAPSKVRFDQAPRDAPTTAGLAGALIVSFSPRERSRPSPRHHPAGPSPACRCGCSPPTVP